MENRIKVFILLLSSNNSPNLWGLSPLKLSLPAPSLLHQYLKGSQRYRSVQNRCTQKLSFPWVVKKTLDHRFASKIHFAPLSKPQQVRSAVVNKYTYLPTCLHPINLTTIHVLAFFFISKRWRFDADFSYSPNILLFSSFICHCCARLRVTKSVTRDACTASCEPLPFITFLKKTFKISTILLRFISFYGYFTLSKVKQPGVSSRF